MVRRFTRIPTVPVFGLAHRSNCYGANEGKVRCLRAAPAPYFDRRAPIPGNKRSGQAFLRRPVDIPALRRTVPKGWWPPRTAPALFLRSA
jgi:hypothetical protein